ncbi:MAG: HAD-IA family hydrolase [Clostridiales bacterium]|nr:HAD-IA family hydrolase [Clostridiales bacterium]
MIKAVVFDLDDTLYPEYDYVLSGFAAVGEYAQKQYGIADVKSGLIELFSQSRDKVFDRFAQNHGIDKSCVADLVEVYRTHTPDIKLTDEVKQTLSELRAGGYKLGIITDGRPNGQRAKIKALGLNELVDEIIITDELGEDCRKPNPKAFEVMADRLGVTLDQMAYVGDNPQKDFVIGKHGVTTVKYNGDGLYGDCGYLDGIKEHKSINTMSELINCLEQNKDKDDDGLLEFVKGKLLEIMDFIHDVCVKENIKYSLSGGTMIGAVRHKGFIPWDDDIDITMLREEYNRFASVVKDYCDKSGKFEFFLYRRTPRVKFAKDPIWGDKQIGGIKVDIFLLDNLPDDMRKRKRFLLKLKVLQGMMHKGKINWSRFSFKNKLRLLGTKILGAGRSLDSIVKSYFKVSARYNDQQTQDKFISNDLFAVCHIAYRKEWVSDVILSAYEDREYNIFAGYDSFLRVRYGDYMQLPPVEQRVHHHNFTLNPIENSEAQG